MAESARIELIKIFCSGKGCTNKVGVLPDRAGEPVYCCDECKPPVPEKEKDTTTDGTSPELPGPSCFDGPTGFIQKQVADPTVEEIRSKARVAAQTEYLNTIFQRASQLEKGSPDLACKLYRHYIESRSAKFQIRFSYGNMPFGDLFL